MALIGIEGFDHENSSFSDLAQKPGWAVSGTLTKATGRITGSCLTYNNSSASLNYTFTAAATVIVGFAWKTTIVTNAASEYICIFRDAGTAQCGIGLNTAGKLIFWRNSVSTVLGTGTTVLSSNTWYYIECKVTINDTTGSFDVHLNGVSELSASGVDTKQTTNATVDTLGFPGPVSGAPVFSVDDMYVCNTTGSSPYNDFLGDCQVETLFVSSNNTVAFTPLSSTNASNVDDTANDADSTYNSTSSSSTVDLFNMTDMATTPTTVFGVQASASLRSDATSINARTKLKSNTTTQNGATKSISTSYLYTTDIYTADPATTVAWLPADVNAALVGYENI